MPKVVYSRHMTTSRMVMMLYMALVFFVCLYLRIGGRKEPSYG